MDNTTQQKKSLAASEYAPAVTLVAHLNDLEIATHDVGLNTVEIESLKLGRRVDALIDCVRDAQRMYDDAVKLLTSAALEVMEFREYEETRSGVSGIAGSGGVR